MKRHMALAFVLAFAILSLTTIQATAETVLISGPILEGNGTVYCGCINISKNTIPLEITRYNSSGSAGSANAPTLEPGRMLSSEGIPSGNSINYCIVSRSDGKSISTKQVVCNLSARDSSGNATVVVPVDTKYKR